MKNNSYLKTTYRDIKYSFGRFIAVILIIFMGVLLFVGIKSVGPDLNKATNHFIAQQNLSDVQIQGTAGLTEKDQDQVMKLAGAKAELGYSFSYEDDGTNLQVYSYNEKQKQNRLIVTQGRLPEKKTEAVVDAQLKDKYSIGDKLTIDEDQLEEEQVKVVGFVESPIYVNNTERGSTTVGDGELDGVIYISQENFDSEVYSIMYLTFADLSKDFFSAEYENKLNDKVDQLDEIFAKRKTTRKQELTDDALDVIDKEQQKLTKNQKKLSAAQKELDQAGKKLDQQTAQFEKQKKQLETAVGKETAQQQLKEEEDKLSSAKKQLTEQQKDLTEKQAKLAEGQAEIDDAKKDAEDIDLPNYFINDRQSNPGFNEFTSLPERIDAIGNVFPVFFFLIAILITFTTITRMIEENRREIGTLKALGYRNLEIASKYLLYALLTALIGTSLGIVAGTKLLPPIVFSMLTSQFTLQNYVTYYWATPILIAVLAALLATLGSAIYVLSRDLRAKPTSLLQAKTPKAGQRIFLERITPIWSKLGFLQKVTGRNLFRYKARMILTVLGIAGCTGLIVAGFGLRDSIAAPAQKQFQEIMHYQATVRLEDDALNDPQKVVNRLENENQVKDFLAVYTDQVTLKSNDLGNQTATLTVYDNQSDFEKYVSFIQPKKEQHEVTTGAVISERLAKYYDVTVGDTLKLQDSKGNQYQLKIAALTKNYLGHNVYLSQAYFDQLTDTNHQPNAYLVKTAALSKNQEQKLAKKLEKTNQVTNTAFNSSVIQSQAYASTNLSPVVSIFIILSGTLAFVVLYNLTNINISERQRELATIKVLGFYDKEVTMYIVRENVVFTCLGILLGFGIGKVLTWFIVLMASSDLVVFPLVVPAIGYLVAAVMTFIFSAIVMVITHFKLKNIDMIGALNSNE
ncbi:MAG TPA: FtsX-like permease family protein [Tetragenococcus sp.]|nr:FtsX-like permease family protein [Tetragenococcus sp.]